MGSLRRARRLVTGTVERFPRLARTIVELASKLAIVRGADSDILAEATIDPDRPFERSLQIVAWSIAITGTAALPRHFSPGDHLDTTAARRAAEVAVRGRMKTDDDPRLHRDLIGLLDTDLHSAATDVEAHLRRVIGDRALRPQRGDGLDPAQQLSIVDELTVTLAESGIRPFLMSGTLLGFVREGSFLRHDYDIDLGVLPGVDLRDVEATLRRLPAYDVAIHGRRLVARHESGVDVDVFAHEQRDELLWHSTLIHEWWNTPFELEEATIDGVRVWIPDAAERYLDENYGSWQRSVPFYDISFDTPNRRYQRNAETLRFLHSRCDMAVERGDRWLLESAARELRDEFGIDVTELLAPSRLLER